MSEVSKYWQNHGKTVADKKHGRTFEMSNGRHGCNECCNGDRCDDESHQHRPNCRNCLGTGSNLTSDELNAMAANKSQNLSL